MGEVEGLAQAYARAVRLPWDRGVAGPERVWFAVYDKTQERRLRLRLALFEQATREAGHGWQLLDLTDTFGNWMAAQEHCEAYFRQPRLMTMTMGKFSGHVAALVTEALRAPEANETSVVAILGVGALFGLTSVSTVIDQAAPAIRGRLLVFFPGEQEGNNYRLLDARDGWNYRATPISAARGGHG